MRKLIPWIAAALIVLAGVGAYAATDRTADAMQFVQMLRNGRFQEAISRCDEAVKQQMSAALLQQIWQGVIQQYGAFSGTSGAHQSQMSGYDVVNVTCNFAKGSLDLSIAYDSSGKISGIHVLPPGSSGGAPGSANGKASNSDGKTSAETPYAVPSYVRKDRFDEYRIFVNEETEWELPGTLTMPRGEGPFPALVLVHGSGPNDRDETIGPNKPFKDIAWGLASRGIAVLRYDKRTKANPASLAKVATKLTVKEEVLDDALAAVAMVRDCQRIDKDRVFVLGHSLGGMLAPRIGKGDPRIAGLIVLAGATRRLEDVLLEQVMYITSLGGPISAETQAELAKIKKDVAAIKALKPGTKETKNLFHTPPSYWLDLKAYSPTETAKSLKQPMLIMQGGRDYQVTEADFKMWKEQLSARSDVTFKLYPDLNHCFMTGTGKATPAEYEKPGSVDATAVDDMATWINAQGAGGVK